MLSSTKARCQSHWLKQLQESGQAIVLPRKVLAHCEIGDAPSTSYALGKKSESRTIAVSETLIVRRTVGLDPDVIQCRSGSESQGREIGSSSRGSVANLLRQRFDFPPCAISSHQTWQPFGASRP